MRRKQVAATQTVDDATTLHLPSEDQACFVDALLNPPEPNAALDRAFARRRAAATPKEAWRQLQHEGAYGREISATVAEILARRRDLADDLTGAATLRDLAKFLRLDDELWEQASGIVDEAVRIERTKDFLAHVRTIKPRKVRVRPYDAATYLRTPEELAEYLRVALEEDAPDQIREAARTVLRALDGTGSKEK